MCYIERVVSVPTSELLTLSKGSRSQCLLSACVRCGFRQLFQIHVAARGTFICFADFLAMKNQDLYVVFMVEPARRCSRSLRGMFGTEAAGYQTMPTLCCFILTQHVPSTSEAIRSVKSPSFRYAQKSINFTLSRDGELQRLSAIKTAQVPRASARMYMRATHRELQLCGILVVCIFQRHVR